MKNTIKSPTALRGAAMVGASIFAMAAASPAFAQDSGASAQQSQGGVQQIIVSATRTDTNLQETPIAITAVTAQDLEQRAFTSVEDVGRIVPNASFEQAQAAFGRAVTAYIRGIGQNDFNLAFEPGVAFYVDDQYYALLAGSVFDLLDLERVEVLRGPQGTLFGRNAIGGAVNLISRQPGPTPEASIEATYGRYNRTDLRGSFNVPLSDNLFLRVSGVSKNRQGYQRVLDFRCDMFQRGTPELAGNFPSIDPSGGFIAGNGGDDCVIDRYGGEDVQAVRGALRYEGTGWDFTFTADYTNDDSPVVADKQVAINPGPSTAGLNANVYQPLWGIDYDQRFLTDSLYTTYATYADPIPAGSQFPAGCATDPLVNCTYYNGAGDRGGIQLDRRAVIETWGFSGRLNVDLSDDFSFTMLSGYRDVFTTGINDTDGSPIGFQTVKTQITHEQFTIEPRINYSSDFMDLTVGAFYYNGDGQTTSNVSIPFIPLQQNALITFDSEAWAVFGQAVLHPFSPDFGLTLGARYSDDTKDTFFNNGQGGIAQRVLVADNHFDWRVGLDYQVTPDVLIYGSAASGYRPGAFNPRPFQASQLQPVAAEEAIAYELGFKGDLFDRTMRFNVAGFYTDYRQRITPAGGSECIDSGVSGDCVVPGAQVEIDNGSSSQCRAYDPVADGPVNLGAGIGVTCIPKTNYINTPGEVYGIEAELEWRPVEPLTINASIGYTKFDAPELEANSFVVNTVPVYVPEWTASAGIQYEIPVPGLSGSITPRMDMFYQSALSFNSTSALAQIPGRTTFNGRITYRNDDGDFSISLGATNLFDRQYFHNLFDLTPFGQPTAEGQPAAPREWYISVRKEF
ncbi:TonB-dependent receptor [Parasphingopyxis marina]|uniref:TonB-dependent receptor n=1 Tax=Parasphingopyxis marina TaxID=2761622 RepID=A0A842HW99_9SPHN|nr:TonB-dependent receptor [Parasphingopyxis marina]MBC2777175.1 TonB-dependent receptor [Parasphingopyxis marina]